MKKVGILGLSNPCDQNRVNQVTAFLESIETEVVVSNCLTRKSTPQERAEIFNQMMKMNLDFVFDISGGDLANTTLPYLELDNYKNSSTIFHGYSDLTCVLNVLASYRSCVLFQIAGNTNLELIEKYIHGKDSSLIIDEVIGGNIRCLLKLAGTPYFPEVKGKRLLLESFSGSLEKIQVYFAQLEQMGVLEKIEELILGQCSEIDQKGQREDLVSWLSHYPCQLTQNLQIGHSCDSMAVIIKG